MGQNIRRRVIVGWSCLTLLMVKGCVMKSTYDAAVYEGSIAKAELDRLKEEQSLLIRQVSRMEQSNAETMRDAETASAALLQVKEEADRERQTGEMQILKLKQKIAQLAKQQHAVQYELTVAKENTAALQELIEVYQKKVRDGVAAIPSSSSTDTQVSKPFDPSTIPPPQELPPPPAVAPAKPVTIPAQGSSAASGKPSADPGDSSWFSSVKGWIISLWRAVFS